MKTELYRAIVASKLSESDALNLLQDRGAISDLCITLKDVPEADCPRAVAVLLDDMRTKKMEVR